MQIKKFEQMVADMEVLQYDETGKMRGGFAVALPQAISNQSAFNGVGCTCTEPPKTSTGTGGK